MVISKCVPLEISRRRFSDFLQHDIRMADDLFLVGYAIDQSGKKVNKKVPYSSIKNYIDENGGTAGGGNNNDSCGCRIKRQQPVFNQFGAAIVCLEYVQGYVDINPVPGQFNNEFTFLFTCPKYGTITRLSIDNTGIIDQNGNHIQPQDVIINYGTYVSENDLNGHVQIASVPAGYRSVIQIFHSHSSDIIVNVHYSTGSFVNDVDYQESEDNSSCQCDCTNKTPIQELNKDTYYIDMQNHRGYIQFKPQQYDSYTFCFSQPQFGTITYMIIDHTDQKNINQYVKIFYGVKETQENGNIKTKNQPIQITQVKKGTKTMIEIFHSHSADLVINVVNV